jgi:hypothetical protein
VSTCPKCGCDAGAHFMICPRMGGPISFSFDRLFAAEVMNDEGECETVSEESPEKKDETEENAEDGQRGQG